MLLPGGGRKQITVDAQEPRYRGQCGVEGAQPRGDGLLRLVVGDFVRLHAAKPAQVQQTQIPGGETGPNRNDRGEYTVTVDVELVGALLVLAVEVDDDILAAGPSESAVTDAVGGDDGRIEHALWQPQHDSRVPQFVRYRCASKYFSISLRGSPLKSPHSYVLTKLVALMSARVDSDRNSASSRAVRGRSTAVNS